MCRDSLPVYIDSLALNTSSLLRRLLGLLLRLSRLLLTNPPQDIGVPLLADVGVGLDAVPQRRLAQRLRDAAAAERELDIVQPPAPVGLEDGAPLRLGRLGHVADADGLELRERRAPAHALEEGDREARARGRRRRQHAVRRRAADALRQRLEALADGHDERAVDGRAVDPLAPHVLHLQAPVPAGLQQVAREHAVLVRAHALALHLAVAAQPQLRDVRVLDDLELAIKPPESIMSTTYGKKLLRVSGACRK